MLNYIIKHKGRISDGFDSIKARKLARWRTLIVPAIFILGIPICMILPGKRIFSVDVHPLLIWPTMLILNRFYGAVKDLEFKQPPTRKA
jgi:hypothetical protein